MSPKLPVITSKTLIRMTLTVILQEAKNVKHGEIIELVTSFLPAPGIDIMKSKGFSV
ncbi:MAG: hypothetical protein P9L92_10770 [Candidatus Electryonea clarkiae]|nr:hypothetical protein [Candidatus Electryonea clarkiae]MDP8287117.1 hypothetical protein [Candidatus Electryonea clarkiae]